MKRPSLVAVGVLLAVVGMIWTLQGLDYLGGSAMTGDTVWAVIGPVVAVVGLALAVAGSRGRRSGR